MFTFGSVKISWPVSFRSIGILPQQCIWHNKRFDRKTQNNCLKNNFNFLEDDYLKKVMKEFNVKNFVFSSSATVYGLPQYLPLDEKHITIGDQITNPYGKTKYVVEHVLKDLYQSDKVILF